MISCLKWCLLYLKFCHVCNFSAWNKISLLNNQSKKYVRHNLEKKKIRSFWSCCWVSCCVRFYPSASGWAEGESTGDWANVAVVTKQYFPFLSFLSSPTYTHPLSCSQALILLASPRARRGVRVGSICLYDGHWCQAPWGLEGEERTVARSGRVTDVSELSSGTLNGA